MAGSVSFLQCSPPAESSYSFYRQLTEGLNTTLRSSDFYSNWKNARRISFIIRNLVHRGYKRCDLYNPEPGCEKRLQEKKTGLKIITEKRHPVNDRESEDPQLLEKAGEERYIRNFMLSGGGAAEQVPVISLHYAPATEADENLLAFILSIAAEKECNHGPVILTEGPVGRRAAGLNCAHEAVICSEPGMTGSGLKDLQNKMSLADYKKMSEKYRKFICRG